MNARWLALVVLLVGCQSQPRNLIPAVMQQAHEVYARGDFELTVRLCDFVLQRDPQHLAAQTLRHQAELDRRSELLRWSRDLDPTAVPQVPGHMPVR